MQALTAASNFIQNKYLLSLLSKHTDKILDRQHKIIEEIIFESIKTKANSRKHKR